MAANIVIAVDNPLPKSKRLYLSTWFFYSRGGGRFRYIWCTAVIPSLAY